MKRLIQLSAIVIIGAVVATGGATALGRRLRGNRIMIRALTIFVLLSSALTASTLPAMASSDGSHSERQHKPWQIGIWKSAPIPKNATGQFGNQDPFALAHGEHIHTDCSIYWINPADNNLYCFNSGTSKEFFAENPAQYVPAARATFRSEKDKAGSGQP